MLTYLKIALAGLLVASVLILGWEARGWRVEAQAAKQLRVDLAHEKERRVAADRHRLAVEESLAMAESQTHETIRELIKRVVVKVPDNRDCDLDADVVRMLERARGNELPDTTRSPDDGPTTSPAPSQYAN